jgi:RNA exonuclease 1
MSAKKYKLFSATESDGGKKACAFFSSPAGCRNGDKCPFQHGDEEKKPEVSETSSVISSESEASVKKEDLFATPVAAKSENKVGTDNSKKAKKAKRKAAPVNDDDFLFASPKGKVEPDRKKAMNQSPTLKQTPNKKQKRTDANNPAAKEEPASSFVDSFRSLISKLPVASFSVMDNGGGTSSKKPEDLSEVKNDSQSSTMEDKLPLPKSTEHGRKWLQAVLKTREHDRYKTSFDFTKYKQLDQQNGIQREWIKAKPFGSWCKSNPQAIAIDCEMCETKDPLSGSKNHKALCRVSIVNAENPEEVLLDTLVKPVWPVTDYRSRINGIKKEHLENVEFTLRHAQAFMMALCSEETVIVGHALHNDLSALNMEHHCNADSSFLFHAKDSKTATVSLKDCVSNVLQKTMPETHDSVNDARKAFECVLHWTKKGGRVEEIERTTYSVKGKELFVHRIPKQCKAQNLSSMFQTHTDIEPTEIGEIEFSGDTGKCQVTFRTPRHTKLAFDSLEGTAEPDKSGRLQKKVYLRNGDYVRIRKMVYEPLRRESTSTPNKK